MFSFILLASSDNDEHMLMRKKCEQIFPYTHYVTPFKNILNCENWYIKV